MPKFKENVPLSKFNHYKIGAQLDFFCRKERADIRWAIKEANKRKLKVFVLGGGTNLLIDDNGFDGLVLKPEIKDIKAKGITMTVGAGATMADILTFAAARSLAGLEWAGGLPGTVGARSAATPDALAGRSRESLLREESGYEDREANRAHGPAVRVCISRQRVQEKARRGDHHANNARARCRK